MASGDAQVRLHDDWPSRVDLSGLLEKLGGEMSQDAQRYAPVRTGELRDSIDHQVVNDRSPDGFDQMLVVYATAEHAGFVELGTSRSPAQPYLRPALEQKRGGL